MVNKKESFISENNNEELENPYVKINITRHANRLASGILSEDGIKAASEKGQSYSKAEVYKGYAPSIKDDKTHRAYETIETINKTSEIKFTEGGRRYNTKEKSGLSYNISGPLNSKTKECSKLIDVAVKKDYPDFVSGSEDPKWGSIREKYQKFGFNEVLAKEKEIVHIFAMGTANKFYDLAVLGERYSRNRNYDAKIYDAKPIEKDIILDEGTHGLFIESFLKKALIRAQKGGAQKNGYDTWVDENNVGHVEEAMGDFFKPVESLKTKYKVGESIPDKLPIEFEEDHFVGEECFLDMEKVKKLHDQFAEYKIVFDKWENDSTDENAKKLIETVDKLIEEFDK